MGCIKDKVDYLISIHTIPKDLVEGTTPAQVEMRDVYTRVTNTDLLFPVWMIDEYGSTWIEVNCLNADSKAEFHTLKLDDDTFTQVDCFEEYGILRGKSSALLKWGMNCICIYFRKSHWVKTFKMIESKRRLFC